MPLSTLALSQGTDQLPRIDVTKGDPPSSAIGSSTEEAIRAGVFWGTVGALREILGRAKRRLEAPVDVFLTGGDMQHLARYVDADAVCVPHLVLTGIAIAANEHQRSATRP
jgi:type III pantothenate kinase